jgi:hypothetical protein
VPDKSNWQAVKGVRAGLRSVSSDGIFCRYDRQDKPPRFLQTWLAATLHLLQPAHPSHPRCTLASVCPRRTLADNMVVGVSSGFEKRMEMVGTGYRASTSGKELTLNVGYSKPRILAIPDGLSVKVGLGRRIWGQCCACCAVCVVLGRAGHSRIAVDGVCVWVVCVGPWGAVAEAGVGAVLWCGMDV